MGLHRLRREVRGHREVYYALKDMKAVRNTSGRFGYLCNEFKLEADGTAGNRHQP